MYSGAVLPDRCSLGECDEEYVPLRHEGMMLYQPGSFFVCGSSGRSDLSSGGILQFFSPIEAVNVVLVRAVTSVSTFSRLL